jgi:hypothetical protein
MIHHTIYFDDDDHLYRYYATGKRVLYMEFDKMINKFTNGKTDDNMEIYTIAVETEPLHSKPAKPNKIKVNLIKRPTAIMAH